MGLQRVWGGSYAPPMNARFRRRMDRVRILLETRDDYLPGPRSLELPAEAGVAEGRRVPCECRNGRIQKGSQVRLCLVCNGSAWRLRRAGEPAWDEYVGSRVGGEETSQLRTMSRQELDETITRLERAELAREDRVAKDDLIGWERGRRARDASGSYEELERSLERLRVLAYTARRTLDLHYGAGMPVPERRLELIIAWLAGDMRGPVRIPLWAWEQETEKLHGQVLELGEAGLQVSEIASALEMSQRRVKQLLARKAA